MSSSYLLNQAILGDGPGNVVAVCISFLVVAWVAVILRVFVRQFMIKAFGWDDWTILMTLFLFTCETSFLIYGSTIETSTSMKDAMDVEDLSYLAHLTNIVLAIVTLYVWVTVFLKISLAFFFLRIIQSQWQQYFIIANTVVYSLFGISISFVAIFECGNPNHFVSNSLEGRCIKSSSLNPLNYVAAVYNALIDWLYVFFPLYVVYRSKFPWKRKLSVCVLIALAGVGSIASLIRIDYINGLERVNDFYSHALGIEVWSVIEPGLGITAVSLATLRPLLIEIYKKGRSWTGSSFLKESRPITNPAGESSGARDSVMVEDLERDAGLGEDEYHQYMHREKPREPRACETGRLSFSNEQTQDLQEGGIDHVSLVQHEISLDK